ncbi:MAG TPA: aminotransferase class I/II-fold pyridoxal phosphate-dependent enzyme [Candidatus Acidoferrales bacterium]|jgi:alanine-synthesizing transaminase|nr:aminotransferase class I/II-fold pyridoxal phosphate-dependent enzyme [Candidatus Acidoferrales bacterium]
MPTTQTRVVTAASRLDNVRYAIRDLACVADEVIQQGHKVLPLNVGDPLNFDFQTPPHIIEAACKAMRDGKNGYAPSPGIPEALAAIRDEAMRKSIMTVHDVFVTSGVSETVDLCISALVNPGEDILTPKPDYPLYSAVLCKLGIALNAYDLNEDDAWQPELADIERKLTARTRGIVLINPNNPTGSLCSREMLEQVAEIARRHNLVVFSDEIYDKLILDGTSHIAFASVAPDVPCITFGGMSKNYLVPGWRIGWGIVSGDTAAMKPYTEGIHRLLRARLCANHPEQYAIKAALEGPQDHLIEVQGKLRSRRDLTQQWCEATPRVSCVAPRGAFYAFPRIDIPDGGIPESDEGFVKELIRQKHVMVVHGSGFGQKPGTQHFRIVFLPDEKTLSEAYASIGEFIRERY